MQDRLTTSAGHVTDQNFKELRDLLVDPAVDRVKLGVDVRTGETVAIKIMYKDNMSARAVQQLRREITSMKALNHPNVLRLKDVHEVRHR